MATKTARDLIKATLKEIRVIGVGQSVNNEVEQDSFLALNNMIESWSLDNHKIVAETEESQSLTSGTSRYTVGSGGDFDTNRPIDILDDVYIEDSGGNSHSVRLVTQDVYRAMLVKTTSGRPRIISYTPEFPLGKISLYPTPNDSSDTLKYRAKVLLSSFATLTTSVNFYPGMERAIIKNLAIEIAPRNGKRVSNELILAASNALDLIDRQNALRKGMQPVRLDELSRLTKVRKTGNILEGPYT